MTIMSTQHSTNLAETLQSLGVEIKRVGDREITGKCPVHIRTVGREDKSPSWSMNASTGLWICFSCGARGSLSSLLWELAGDGADGLSIQKMLVEASYNSLTKAKPAQEELYVDREAFFRFARVPEKLSESRNLDGDVLHSHGVRWNTERKSWAIPIMSPSGLLNGWQEKKLGSVLNFPVGVKKSLTLFGIERFRSKAVVLVESPLDVVRFAQVGIPDIQAMATFGAHVSQEQIKLTLHLADKVIVAMDNDSAGVESSKRIYKQIGTPRSGLYWWDYTGTSAKDIGDMSDDEIRVGVTSAKIMPPWIV